MAARMFIRSLVFALAFCLVAQPAIYAQDAAPAQQRDAATQPAQPEQAQATAQDAAAIKTELQNIGKGNQAIVVFQDGTTHAGRIKKLGNETFNLDEGGKGNGSYLYADVSSVNKPQAGSSIGAKVMPIAFLASGLVVVAGMVGFAMTKAKTNPTTTATSAVK